MISLVAALGLSGVIFTYPNVMAHSSHNFLSLAMLGICAGFIHGVGFVPETKMWRILFSPWVAWALMGLVVWRLFLA